MTATYTADVFSTVDGFGAPKPGTWGGYWDKQGAELLDHRRALYGDEQRMVFGANTYRLFVRFERMLGSSPEADKAADPWVTKMRNLPATVVSTTLQEPSTGHTRLWRRVMPWTSSPGSRRSPRCRCARTAACR